MPNERGIAKQNIQRAIHNAQRIQDRIGYLLETHKEFPEFHNSIVVAHTTANGLELFLQEVLRRLP